jgi:hypothetical protein
VEPHGGRYRCAHQGSLLCLLIREGQPAATARAILAGTTAHRQVTDAYLAQLARARGARLATFDQALAKLHGTSRTSSPTGRAEAPGRSHAGRPLDRTGL